MMKISFLLLWSLSCIQTFGNEVVSGKVTAVVDGNTLEIVGDNKQQYTIVLAGIDSPELTQEYGEKAKKYLERMALEETVIVQFQGKDRKGNHLAVVLLKGETDLRIELLKEGLAWTSEKNPLPELESHRTKAKEKGKGLWKEENPTPPWAYRRQQSMLEAKSS
jgi:endonuclease YncB( thermonuclease family)